MYITFYHWNVLGPAFLQSLDSVEEELLIFLFQPIISHADNVFPFKIAPLHGGSGPPSNALFLGPTGVHIPKGISISSAIFAGFKIVTDRLCYPVWYSRSHLHSSEMWPNNKSYNVVVTDGTNQWQYQWILYCNVYLYQSTNFLNSPCDISELYRADIIEFIKNINLFDEL